MLPNGRPSTPPASPVSDVDVVVVGAGISGLAVADGLIRAGRSVRVFEAGPSLGGPPTGLRRGKKERRHDADE